MGLHPWEYNRYTWAQFQQRAEGYIIDKERDMECAREVCYTVYCMNVEPKDRKEKYDIWPLSIDPTPKERKKAEKRQAAKDIRQLQKRGKDLVKFYKANGLLK